VPRICIVYPGIYLTTEEKLQNNLSQGNQKTLVISASDAIRLVTFAIANNSFDWTAGPCRPWLSPQAKRSNLVERKYLPSCRTRGFPTSANFESKLSINLNTHRRQNQGKPKL
jgi:hypothetical protein